MDSSDFAPLDLSRVSDPAGPSSSATPPSSIEGTHTAPMDQRLPRTSSEAPTSPLLGKRKTAPTSSPLEAVASQQAGLALSASSGGPSLGLDATLVPRPGSPERSINARPVIVLPGTPATTAHRGGDTDMTEAGPVPPRTAPPKVSAFVMTSLEGPSSPISKVFGTTHKPALDSITARKVMVASRRAHDPRVDVFAPVESEDEANEASGESWSERGRAKRVRRATAEQEGIIRRRLTYQAAHPLPEEPMQDVELQDWDLRSTRASESLPVAASSRS